MTKRGNEVDRKNKHGKLWHLFHSDTWTQKADSGQSYKLDSALNPLKDGQRYQMVSQQDTQNMLGGFLKDNGWTRSRKRGLRNGSAEFADKPGLGF